MLFAGRVYLSLLTGRCEQGEQGEQGGQGEQEIGRASCRERV